MCAIAISVFMPGSCNLYYGTEILTEGGYDPDSRRTFDWDRLRDPSVRKFTDEVAMLLSYKRQPAIKDGAVSIYSRNGLFVIERSNAEQTLTLSVSRGGNRTAPDGIFRHNADISYGENSFTINVKGRLK